VAVNCTVHLNGLSLGIADEGSGPPVVFVHGFPLNREMWDGQRSVCAGARFIAPDLRGFGASDASGDCTAMATFANDLHGILDELGINEPVIFVGLSMGGYISWPFISQRPDRVRGLVLANTRVIADTAEGAQTRRSTAEAVLRGGVAVIENSMLEKLFSPTTRERNPGVIEAARSMIRQAKPVGVAAALRGMAERPDVSSRLAGIKVPTLVVAGADDAIFPSTEMEGFARAIPNAEFVRVERAGHMTPMENPSAFNDALDRFLRRVIDR